MNKNLTPKIIFIIVLVALAVWTLYPPNKTLMPGIDLAGGTSLIYEIDSYGLEDTEKKDLAQRMITVLRRRIDPANIQNLIWRPQGNSRFEIQMPLASAEARTKRQNFEKAQNDLLAKNVSRSKIMRSLNLPAEERPELFKDFAQGDPNRITILESLAKVYDERKELQSKRDELDVNKENTEDKISSAGLDLNQIKLQRISWAKLNEQALQVALKAFTDVNDNLDLLTGYVKTFGEWSTIVNQLTNPEKNAEYKNAIRAIDKLNLSEDQLNICLEKPVDSSERKALIDKLKTDFPDRVGEIDTTVAAFDEYRPFKGRLDDPKDLQRMLKGAGILEWRILPTQGHPNVDMDQMTSYVERLKDKGPREASDNNFVWCEIENIEEWRAIDAEQRPTIVAQFGDIALDINGKSLFSNITGKNIGRPLCILLDGIAISAPSINERIPGTGIITGSFTQTQVEDMVNKLNAGSLPARLIEQPISVNTIGPSIGADNRDQGIKAGLIGLVAVVACMAIYYCLAGSIADVALLLNMLFVLAIMAGVRATFTLPGIAGIILTIGMSVDANVLVFERIREEQLKGSSLRIAITNGYQRAFRTIFDANVTTFITAAILYWRASEEVKGFAIVLMLGIASSMFTALFATRVIFDFLLSKRIIKDHLLMLRLIHKPNINWMRLRPVFFGISIALIAIGLAVFLTRDDVKNNKYDIEFTGGTSVQINLKQPLSRQEVADRISKIGNDLDNPALAAANIYSIGQSEKQYEINTTETNKMTVTVGLTQANQKTEAELT
ncbi:MAG: protein translocase subunit SecD, partial [Planctomycetota bacterium]